MQLHMHYNDFKLSLFITLLLELVTLQQHTEHAAAAAADHKGFVSNACCVSLSDTPSLTVDHFHVGIKLDFAKVSTGVNSLIRAVGLRYIRQNLLYIT